MTEQSDKPSVDGLTGCACRWSGTEYVERCELHEAWHTAIHEWADRAKTAERLAALAGPLEQPQAQQATPTHYVPFDGEADFDWDSLQTAQQHPDCRYDLAGPWCWVGLTLPTTTAAPPAQRNGDKALLDWLESYWRSTGALPKVHSDWPSLRAGLSCLGLFVSDPHAAAAAREARVEPVVGLNTEGRPTDKPDASSESSVSVPKEQQ